VPDSAWIALSLADHIGGKKLRALSQHFQGDLRAAVAADSQTLQKIPGIGPKIAEIIRAVDVARIEQSLSQWETAGVRALTIDDADYPGRLGAMADAPATLFVHGASLAEVLHSTHEKTVAIVGTREPGAESLEAAKQIGFRLAKRGHLVVSGLALGIDAAAHAGALKADGLTIAVLGSGVLNVYPPQNNVLAQEIIQRGLIMSEVHPLAEPSASNLVARNRIISGLCDSLIVVETESDGGAMYAARFARTQGRQVFVINHPASGNRELIATGATIIESDLGPWFSG
jgi:DNA processing protein